MGMNKQIVFAPEIVVNSKTDIRTPLSPELQVLMLVMGDFMYYMKNDRVQEGIQLLPYIGRLISYAGLPPILQELICNHNSMSRN